MTQRLMAEIGMLPKKEIMSGSQIGENKQYSRDFQDMKPNHRRFLSAQFISQQPPNAPSEKSELVIPAPTTSNNFAIVQDFPMSQEKKPFAEFLASLVPE